MNGYGRNLIRITKTREQAEYDKENPYLTYCCPECSETLPLISSETSKRYRGKISSSLILVKSEIVNHFWTDFCYDWIGSYYKKVFVDKYKCTSCGAEWESGRYKSNVKERTEEKVKRKAGQ